MTQNLLVSTVQRLSEGSGSCDVGQVSESFSCSPSARPIIGMAECSLLAADTTDFTFKMRLNISVARYLWNVWCLQLGLLWYHGCSQGCRSSCTRSRSQADEGALPEQNLQHEVVCVLCRKTIWQYMTNYHLNLIIVEAWRSTQLLAGSQSNCQERSPRLLFLGRSGRWEFPPVLFW